MISGINSITITGIANNPELSKTQNGDSMLRFTLAGTEVGADENGERINLPFYRTIYVFGRQADRYYPLLQNSRDMTPVFVHGHLATNSREVNGEMRNEIRLRVQEMHILAWAGSRMDNPVHPDQRQQNRLAEAANHVTLLGKLVYDMELRQTPNEHFVLNNRLAVNTKSRNYKGEIKEDTLFIDFSAWRELAIYHQDLEKGTTIFLQGRLKQSSYERDGQRHYRDYVEAESIEVIERPRNLKTNQATETPAEQPAPAAPQPTYQAPPAPAAQPAAPAEQQPAAAPAAPVTPAAPQQPLPQPEPTVAPPQYQQPAPETPTPAQQPMPTPAPQPAVQQPTAALQPAPSAQVAPAAPPQPQEAPQAPPAPQPPPPEQASAAAAAPQPISRDESPF